MKSKPIYRAAIIGCGAVAGGYDLDPDMGWTVTHAGGYHLCPKTELLAVCDIVPEALSVFGKKWGVKHLYKDYEDMLRQERPDIVSICLPSEYHFDAYRCACQIGIPGIYLEKPVSPNLEEALAMRNVRHGRPVAVNYFRRWNPTLKKLKDEFDDGQYGNPLRVTVHYVKGLISNGSHFIDLLRWFWGEPIGIRRIGNLAGLQRDPGVDFELVWANGLTATFLHISDSSYVCHEIDIFTDQARVTIGQRGQTICSYKSIEEPYFRQFRILSCEEPPNETEWRNCSLRAIEEIVKCLDDGGEPSCTLEDGIKAIELCDQVISG